MINHFPNQRYQRRNRRRQEHLATLSIEVVGKTVLEVGAGVGDHTGFFLDRCGSVTSTDARPELVDMFEKRHANTRAVVFDANGPVPKELNVHRVAYANVVLYNLHDTAQAIASVAALCLETLLLETCVTPDTGEAVNLSAENNSDATKAAEGNGCRPTRHWVWAYLARHIEHDYTTVTQLWHEEFSEDWKQAEPPEDLLTRIISVTSRKPLKLSMLMDKLPDTQSRAA